MAKVPDMADAAGYCEQLLREADRDRFLATLFAPAERRAALFALYAFNSEIERVRDIAREPLPGEIRMQWWREVLEGERREEARANPVAAALLQALECHGIQLGPLIDLIEARKFDLYDEPMPSLAALEDYAAKTSSALFHTAGQLLAQRGGQVPEKLSFHSGVAFSIADLLCDFGRHAARRQLYVPLEVLQRYGAKPDDIFAGKPTAEIRAALAEMRLHARGHLAAANDFLAAAPAAVLPAFLPLALVHPLLQRMERRGYDPFRPVDIPQWRRQWMLWRAARRPREMGR